MFHMVNKEICNKIIFYHTNFEKLFYDLLEKYNIDDRDVISTKIYSRKKFNYCISTFLIAIAKDLWVYNSNAENEPEGTVILYGATTPKEKIEDLRDFVNSHEDRPINQGKINLIHKTDYGYDLKSFDVTENECDIGGYYNDDFIEVNNKIISRLNTENDKGLVLLHGKPGTGKTSYIRYLTKKVNKQIIFLDRKSVV